MLTKLGFIITIAIIIVVSDVIIKSIGEELTGGIMWYHMVGQYTLTEIHVTNYLLAERAQRVKPLSVHVH